MAEHPVGQLPALRLFAHADAQPREILPAQKADDRAHAVVRARAALFAHAQLAQRQVNVVVDQEQVIHLRLIPRNQLRHALAGEVHKRLRLDEHQLFPADEALADLPVHRVFGELNMVLFAEHVNHVEADVVPCSGVFPARIAQTDHNEHICLRFPQQPMRERRQGRSR